MFSDMPFGAPPSVALAPIDLTGGAKATLWGSIRDINEFLAILISIGAGTATQDITISLLQATSSAGAGSKALPFKEAWFKRGSGVWAPGTAAAQDKFAKSALATREAPVVGGGYVTTTDRVATTNQFVTMIRVSPKDLDQANGFRYVGASFNSPAASQVAAAFFFPMGNAYSGTTIPSLLV